MDYLAPAQVPHLPQLPAAVQRSLDQQLARMSGVGLAHQAVIDEIAAVNGYAVWRAFNSMVAVKMLRDMAAAQGFLTPEMERMLGVLTEGYLRDIDATCRTADAQLLRLVDDFVAGRAPQETIVAKFKRLLQG